MNHQHLSTGPSPYLGGLSSTDQLSRYHPGMMNSGQAMSHSIGMPQVMYPHHPHASGFMPPPVPHSLTSNIGISTDSMYNGYANEQSNYLSNMLSPGGYMTHHQQGSFMTPGSYGSVAPPPHHPPPPAPTPLPNAYSYPPPPGLFGSPPSGSDLITSSSQGLMSGVSSSVYPQVPSSSTSFNIVPPGSTTNPNIPKTASNVSREAYTPFLSEDVVLSPAGRLSCTKCSYTTSRHDKLEEHMKAHGRGSIVCEECGKAFLKTCDLERHIQVHLQARGRLSGPSLQNYTGAYSNYEQTQPMFSTRDSRGHTSVYRDERHLMQDLYIQKTIPHAASSEAHVLSSTVHQTEQMMPAASYIDTSSSSENCGLVVTSTVSLANKDKSNEIGFHGFQIEEVKGNYSNLASQETEMLTDFSSKQNGPQHLPSEKSAFNHHYVIQAPNKKEDSIVTHGDDKIEKEKQVTSSKSPGYDASSGAHVVSASVPHIEPMMTAAPCLDTSSAGENCGLVVTSAVSLANKNSEMGFQDFHIEEVKGNGSNLVSQETEKTEDPSSKQNDSQHLPSSNKPVSNNHDETITSTASDMKDDNEVTNNEMEKEKPVTSMAKCASSDAPTEHSKELANREKLPSPNDQNSEVTSEEAAAMSDRDGDSPGKTENSFSSPPDMFKVLSARPTHVESGQAESSEMLSSASFTEVKETKESSSQDDKVFILEDDTGLDDICKSAEDAITVFSPTERNSGSSRKMEMVEVTVDERQADALKGLIFCYHCNKCTYSTMREEKILEHVDAHRGHLVCNLCQKAKRCDLDRHMQSHAMGKVRDADPLEEILAQYESPRGYFKIEAKDRYTLLIECGEDNLLDSEFTFIEGRVANRSGTDNLLDEDQLSPSKLQLDSPNICSDVSPKNSLQQSPVSGMYYCKMCTYSTNREDKIRQHLRAHRGKIVCLDCGKAFVKQCDLDRHMVSHSKGRVRRPNSGARDGAILEMDGWDSLQAFPASLHCVPVPIHNDHSLSPQFMETSLDDKSNGSHPTSSDVMETCSHVAKPFMSESVSNPSVSSKFPLMKSALSANGKFEKVKLDTASNLSSQVHAGKSDCEMTSGSEMVVNQQRDCTSRENASREYGSISIMYDKPAYSTTTGSMDGSSHPNIQVANVTIVNNPPSFSSNGNHTNNHQIPEKQFEKMIKCYQCHKCEFATHSAEDFEKHLVSHNRYFPCPYCVLNFTSDKELKVHVNSHHSNLEKAQVLQQEAVTNHQNFMRPAYPPPIPNQHPPRIARPHSVRQTLMTRDQYGSPHPRYVGQTQRVCQPQPMQMSQQPLYRHAENWRPHLAPQSASQFMQASQAGNVPAQVMHTGQVPQSLSQLMHSDQQISPTQNPHVLAERKPQLPPPQSVHEKRPPRYEFKCQHCSFGTNYPQYMKAHMKNHSTLKNRYYFCELCGNRYISLTALRSHMKYHLNNRGHMAFYRNSSLVRCSFVDCEITGDNKITVTFSGNGEIDPRVMIPVNTQEVIDHLNRTLMADKQADAKKGMELQTNGVESHHKKQNLNIKIVQKIAANMAENAARSNLEKMTNNDTQVQTANADTSQYHNGVPDVNSQMNGMMDVSVSSESGKIDTFPDSISPSSSMYADYSADIDNSVEENGMDEERSKLFHRHFKDRSMNCPMCNYSTDYPHKMQEHMDAHRGKFICNLCNKAFVKSSDLIRHMFVHDKNPKKYSCKICDYVTKNPLLLDDHVSGHLKKLTCQFCKKTFAKEATLVKHIERHLNRGEMSGMNEGGNADWDDQIDGTHSCPICLSQFETREELEDHEALHWHACPDCGDNFPTGSALARHMIIHINASCDIPEVRSRAPRIIKTQPRQQQWPRGVSTPQGHGHVGVRGKGRGRSQDRVRRKLCCEVCNKSVSQYYLKDHMRTHTGERPFSCDSCGQRFALKQSLQTHQKLSRSCSRADQGYIVNRVLFQYNQDDNTTVNSHTVWSGETSVSDNGDADGTALHNGELEEDESSVFPMDTD